MNFLKQLNESYHLFKIENGEIEEIDLDEFMDDGQEDAESDDFFGDLGDYELDDMKKVPDEDQGSEPEDGEDITNEPYELNPDNFSGDSSYNLGGKNYNKDLSPNMDDGLEDEIESDDDTNGELELDPNLTGMKLDSDESESEDDDTDFPQDDEDFDEMSQYKTDDKEDGYFREYPQSGESTDSTDNLGVGLDDDNDDVDFDSDDDDLDVDSDDHKDEDDLSDSEEDMGSDEESEDGEDKDFQGTIRTVAGACLVYKRLDPHDNTYTELWIYTTDNEKDLSKQFDTKRAILAGTDINASTMASDDGTVTAEQTSTGNVVFLKIDHLPN